MHPSSCITCCPEYTTCDAKYSEQQQQGMSTCEHNLRDTCVVSRYAAPAARLEAGCDLHVKQKRKFTVLLQKPLDLEAAQGWHLHVMHQICTFAYLHSVPPSGS